MPLILTPEILRSICPTLSIQRANVLADLFYKVLPLFGMYTADIMQEFVAQLAHESGEFTIKTESMNYSPERMMAVWPSRFPSLSVAQRFAGDPRGLANYVYGKRMGNVKPDDGYHFIGAGYLQMTGRDSFTRYAIACNIRSSNALMDAAEYAAQLIRTDDYWALHAACWEFAKDKNLIPLCKGNALVTNNAYKTMTLKINGGYVGLEERTKYLNRALIYLPLKAA